MKEFTIATMNRKSRRTLSNPSTRKAMLSDGAMLSNGAIVGNGCRATLFAIFIIASIMAAPWGVQRAFAQNGKISATIVDAKTGEPLLKATLQILQTKQGAYS